jgi:hypothetical protein
MRRTVLLVLAAAVLATPLALAKPSPSTIALPNGWRPEGIAIKGNTFYVGSIPTGAVYRGSLRTGQAIPPAPLVPAVAGRAAIGLDYHRGRLFVSGGPTGKAFVYDAATGALIREVQLTAATPTFVNDVTIAKGAAYFTDSNQPVIYKLPLDADGAPAATAQTIPLGGEYAHAPGEFNLNGIEATPNGKKLVAVQTFTGKLFTIDPGTGAAKLIEVGGTTFPRGDGLLLHGKRLYVVQNTLNKIAVVRLGHKLDTGKLQHEITAPGVFDVPTTIARKGKWLYAVNARFTTPPTPDTTYNVVRVDRK